MLNPVAIILINCCLPRVGDTGPLDLAVPFLAYHFDSDHFYDGRPYLFRRTQTADILYICKMYRNVT